MAEMKIDLKRLEDIGGNLGNAESIKKLYNYLYQLSEQLRYWQYNVEPDNLSQEMREQYADLIEKSSEQARLSEQLRQEIAILAARVPDRLENETVVIDEDGIEIGDEDALVLDGMTVRQICADEILGQSIIYSDTQPDGAGFVWIKPTGTETAGTGNTVLKECQVFKVEEAQQ